MIFNSYEFLFVFLPITAIIYFLIGSFGHHRAAIAWLVSASLFFYSWWNPAYLGLLLVSIFFNYGMGLALGYWSDSLPRRSKLILTVGVLVNLSVLAYFKYANFFVDNFNVLASTNYNINNIILPLALSFFTFQQIAFLVDSYQGQTKEYNFLHYTLFVTFFPQLIAGPIVHHKEMLPQFAAEKTFRFAYSNLAIGLSILFIGLFKKVVIADGLAIYSNPIFQAVDAGETVWFLEAWGGVLAYTMQLYFDFSGYVDMAVGVARIFGIVLPINFYSPYKSRNIIEFWRRWHITLSRFLRDYLYIPLGGSRLGNFRRYLNLMITMILGGLWHGASWTFVFWGILHGAYLIVAHIWGALKQRTVLSHIPGNCVTTFISWFITFLAVVVGWVFFRSETFGGAISIIEAMFGKGFSSLPDKISGRIGGLEVFLLNNEFQFDGKMIIDLSLWLRGTPLIILSIATATLLPNTSQLFSGGEGEGLLHWRASGIWLLFSFSLFAIALLNLFKISPFLYFNF
jgi:D-alanyl-lipoteichoic acid acyltransferase DltB (MBOAT superfamily)